MTAAITGTISMYLVTVAAWLVVALIERQEAVATIDLWSDSESEIRKARVDRAHRDLQRAARRAIAAPIWPIYATRWTIQQLTGLRADAKGEPQP
jgi:hypothetical protein